MASWELFSKREKAREKAGQEDVFQYDDLPNPFRVQVIHIWMNALGAWHDTDEFDPPRHYLPNQLWGQIYRFFTDEKGVFRLVERRGNPCEQCREYLMTAPTVDALDLIELAFRVVDTAVRNMDEYDRDR
jgi:hypothetical protein